MAAIQDQKLNWGFLSTANIGKKNCLAVKKSGQGKVLAVASRSAESAQSFAEEQEIPQALASYQELIEHPDVDAVYVPLPTLMHHDWVLKAADAGKHVLCEKPIAGDVSEAQSMIAALRTKNLVFLDGLMFMHHPRYRNLQKIIADEENFGRVISVQSGFSFPGMADPEFVKSNIRVKKELEPLGVVGDLGWYSVRFSLFAYAFEIPVAASTFCHRQHEGVPTDVTSTIFFANGRQAHFHCSFYGNRRQNAEITGELRSAYMSDFVLAAEEDQSSFSLSMGKNLLERETVVFRDVCQEANMFSNFAKLVAGDGKPEEKEEASNVDYAYHDPQFWAKVALLTQAVMDACLRSIAKKGRPVAVWPGLAPSAEEGDDLCEVKQATMLSQFTLQQVLDLDFSSLKD